MIKQMGPSAKNAISQLDNQSVKMVPDQTDGIRGEHMIETTKQCWDNRAAQMEDLRTVQSTFQGRVTHLFEQFGAAP